MNTSLLRFISLAVIAVVPLAGCGSSQGTSHSPAGTPSTAAGDIADTATYLTFRGQGYSVKYVEGWSIQQGPGSGVTISDKDSSERIAVQASQAPNVSAGADVASLKRTAPQYHLMARHTVRLAPGNAAYLQYRTLSPRDPVTGKRVPVIVDRYYIPGSGKLAILSLGAGRGR